MGRHKRRKNYRPKGVGVPVQTNGEKPSRAVLYLRVSTKDQLLNLSMETQEKETRRYSAHHDLEVVRVFIEGGVSAKTADRPALKQMLAFCATSGIRSMLSSSTT